MSATEVVVVGARLELRRFDERMISDTYLGWLNDKALMRYSRQREIEHTRDTARAYLRTFDGSPSRFWSIHRRSDGGAIGTLTTYFDPVHRTGDIGILVGAADARGKGFGREAWGLGLDYLFRGEGVRKATGGTSALNAPMVRISRSWNMRLEGTLKEQELVDGRPADVLLFGLLSAEWEALHPGGVGSIGS